jgi:SepF-like predicted cell division protein (DUF552 family)
VCSFIKLFCLKNFKFFPLEKKIIVKQKSMADSETRIKELKAFDETKLGVKGLVDAGITKIPQIFYHPPDNIKKSKDTTTDYTIPVIDLANIHEDPCEHKRVVESVRDASETLGFFQIVNHGISLSTLKEMEDGIARFFEQDSEVKKKYYTRESKLFMYNSNIALYNAALTCWKDSFLCNMVPNPPKPEDLPDVCRYFSANVILCLFYCV